MALVAEAIAFDALVYPATQTKVAMRAIALMAAQKVWDSIARQITHMA
jgi:hypothetical protein